MPIVHPSRHKGYVRFLILCWIAVALAAFGLEGAALPPVISSDEPSTPLPYARIAERPSRYEGPGREREKDIDSEEIKIGLLVPLEGSQAKAGRALQLAAELAIEEVNGQAKYRGRPFRLQTRSTSGPWGRASSEVVRFIYADQVVALVTSTEGATAHLAEQVANKAGVPVLSLAPESTTTEINLPWIFRCVPSDNTQAEALARDIYAQRRFSKVAVVFQENRDGRLGARAFRQVAQDRPGLLMLPLPREPVASDFDRLLERVRGEGVQALVLWAEATAAGRVVRHLRQSGSRVEIYLSVGAAQQPFFALSGEYARGVHVMAPFESTKDAAARDSFAAKYKARTGSAPSPAAVATFDCVRLLAQAVNAVGPNRARLRDYLAGSRPYSGEAEGIAFDAEGNLKRHWTVQSYQAR